MTARSDGSTSPCATTTALMAGNTRAAPERRSQGVPRVSTPYADITQIRFWGLRLSALSAPLSSGAPPSYSVVRVRVYAGRETRRGPRPSWSLVLSRPIWVAASGRFALLRVADRRDRLRRSHEPADHQDREGCECQELHRSPPLDLVRRFAVLRGVETEHFLALGHAQSDEEVDELQDHERHDRRVRDGREHRDRLDP